MATGAAVHVFQKALYIGTPNVALALPIQRLDVAFDNVAQKLKAPLLADVGGTFTFTGKFMQRWVRIVEKVIERLFQEHGGPFQEMEWRVIRGNFSGFVYLLQGGGFGAGKLGNEGCGGFDVTAFLGYG